MVVSTQFVLRGNSWVNAGGIIVRNEKDEFGVDLRRRYCEWG